MNSNTMATPPTTQAFDWNENFKWIAGCITALFGYLYYISMWFKTRAKDKRQFIVDVVEATVKSIMTAELSGIKDSIKELQSHRESDRKHTDEQFMKLYDKIK